MNVLFYTTFEVTPNKGGTERITTTIANGLRDMYGVNCYSLYSNRSVEKDIRTPFVKAGLLPPSAAEIAKYISENQIDIIVNQSSFNHTARFREAIAMSDRKCKLVFVHHFNPGCEFAFKRFAPIIGELRRARGLKAVIKKLGKMALFPYHRMRYVKNLRKAYPQTVDTADRIVLLSANFKDDFLRYSHRTDNGRFEVIHNSLSFTRFFDMNRYADKRKEVLIVSRLTERQKKLSKALEIWRLVMFDTALRDWTLVIVGDGVDRRRYERMVSRQQIPNVRFEGLQKPEPYYQTASLSMMTSSFEGWGLTLTESQQYGVVPFAFRSYKSLTDIITDGVNGCTITNGDCAEYAARLSALMRNDRLRRQMADNAIRSSRRFEQPAIVGQWMQLFTSLLNE